MKSIIFLFYCYFLFSGSWLYAVDAPVITAGSITNAVPGASAVPVPVTVTGFSNIGHFKLTLTFDITRVVYVSASTNPALSGMNVTYNPPSGNNQGKLVLFWTGVSNVSLADGSSLATLTFSYITGTGIIKWAYISGEICQYKTYTGEVLTLLNDSPEYLFYKNGGISNRGAPVTYAPVIAAPSAGALPVTVTATGFTGIGALTLYLEYDPAIITYQGTFTRNAAFDASFLVGDNAGTGGKRLIVIQWYGNGVTLADGSTLCTLNFTYLTAGTGCALTWFDNGPSCEYASGAGDVLIDMPTAGYYLNGSVGGASTNYGVYAKNFLQGPYDATTHTMRTDLAAAGYIPLVQPYNTTPWFYSGSENITAYPAGTVDWVLVELRTGTAANTMVGRRAGLLKSDGTLMEADGSTPLIFESIIPGNAYYVVVYHRSHLPVMTAGAINLPNTDGTRHDFTSNPPANVFSTTNDAVLLLEFGIYGQIAGDLNSDNKLKYSGPSNDRGLIIAKITALFVTPPSNLNSTITGYYAEDLNMNGVVKYSGPLNDQGIIFSNIDVLTNPTLLNSVYQGQVPVSYSTELEGFTTNDSKSLRRVYLK